MKKSSRNYRRFSLGSISIVGAAVIGSPAVAQQAKPGAPHRNQIEEVVVTANKRKENLQKVPIAITAITSAKLEKAGITSTQDLAQVVPGLIIQTSISGAQAHLRGVGTTAIPAGTENSIASYIDGVYILSLSGSMLQLNSIDQVEVVKGPQGTLFGRNATGGVIDVKTRDPKQRLSGNFNIRYGNYNTVSGQGYLTGAITDNLSADIAGYFSNQGDGWGKNLYNGQDVNKTNDYAIRSKWLLHAGADDTFRLAVDFSQSKGNAVNSFAPIYGSSTNYGPGPTLAGQRPDLAPYIASGALAPFAQVGQPFTYTGGFYDIDTATQPRDVFDTGGVSLQWDHNFGGAQLTSITAYRRAYKDQFWSSEPSPANTFIAGWTEREEEISQETRLASAAGSPIQWVAGLYYLFGKASYNPFTVKGTAQAPIDTLTFNSFSSTNSGAAFGQATVPLWEGAHLTGGLRYSIERRAIKGDTVVDFASFTGIPRLTTGITDANHTFDKLTWRGSLDQKITPDVLGYLSVNRGFKSGIYNTIPAGGPGAKPVSPEILDAYEAGLKTDFFDHRLRLNMAGYYYDYSNLQVTVFTSVSASIQNGAKAKIYGGDMDLAARITPDLTLTGGLNLMHSEFVSYPNAEFFIPQPASAGGGDLGVSGSAKGKSLPYAPNTTFNVGADYATPVGDGSADLNVNYAYTGRWFAGPDNILHQGAYGLLNATGSYTLAGDHVTLSIWGRNLTASKYYVFLAAAANPSGTDEGLVGAPRTYGFSVGYKF